MSFLLRTITNKAKETFAQPFTKDNWDEWIEHWLNTADILRMECANEGLVNTVNEITEIIFEQERLVRRI